LIDDESEIDLAGLPISRDFGDGGASAPEHLVHNLLDRLRRDFWGDG